MQNQGIGLKSGIVLMMFNDRTGEWKRPEHLQPKPVIATSVL